MKIIEDLISPKPIKSICKKLKLKKIGWGSSRVVYRISKTRILKVASNKKGILQNEHEVKIYNGIYNKASSELFTTVYWYDPKFKWIISEYANPMIVEDSDCRKIRCCVDRLGLDLQEMEEFGIAADGKCKLIDYGLSEMIYENHY